MSRGSLLAVIAWLIWGAVAAITAAAIWRYSRRKSVLGFWQFTAKQALAAVSVWTLLMWMVYSWCLNYFGH